MVLKVCFKKQFTITYLPGEQGTFEEQTIEHLDYRANMPEFVGTITGNKGYNFIGWSPAITENVTQNKVYTAMWEIKRATITFNTNGGTLVDSITGDYGTTITAPANPTKAGKAFVKWEPTIPETIPAKNTEVTAIWKDRELTGIEITKQPTKTIYTAFENFDETGMQVTAIYDNGERKLLTEYTVENGENLQVGQTEVIIKYEGKEAVITITVSKVEKTQNPDYLESLEELRTEGGKEVTYYKGLKLKNINLLYPWKWAESEKLIYANEVGEEQKITYKSQNINYTDVENVVKILVKVEKANPVFELPIEIQAIYGDTLEQVKNQLAEGFEFQYDLDTKVGNVGYNEFKVRYIPEDTENYNIVENISVIIKVEDKITPVTGIELIQSLKIIVGKKETLTAKVLPEEASNKEIIWRSCNSNIVTVDEKGNVEAKEKGATYIIAKTKDGWYSASCRVEVIEMTYILDTIGEDICIKNINPNTNIETFKEKFPTKYEVKIYNQKGEEIGNDTKIGTGFTLGLYDENHIQLESICLVVKGDVNGDGEAECTDSVSVIYYRINKNSLDDVYLKAADLNNDGEVDGRDSTILIYHRLNKEGFEWLN